MKDEPSEQRNSTTADTSGEAAKRPIGVSGRKAARCASVTSRCSPVIVVHCRVEVRHKTGVEMEALTGASVAALTIYDMCKALDKTMRITDIVLVSKTKK